ncbi:MULTISPECIES: Rv3654c family TadE-like protein [Micrococcales]|uniref:Rv3654c family TadE-like protein n=1 Tax=Micrococcales TaxID=85006 RepID=UPI00128EC766|nr:MULTISPECIES: Rv3654c family TadE-like protein [Micrococcales]
MIAPRRRDVVPRGLRDGPDRGSGSVLAVALLGAIMVMVVFVIAAGQAAWAHHRARTAADLAALAAADAARGLTSGEPCAVARRVAEANGARLVGCCPPSDRGEVRDVRVEADVPAWLGRLGPVTGLARAGPPRDDLVQREYGTPAFCA